MELKQVLKYSISTHVSPSFLCSSLELKRAVVSEFYRLPNITCRTADDTSAIDGLQDEAGPRVGQADENIA